jgi:hypothetical protein
MLTLSRRRFIASSALLLGQPVRVFADTDQARQPLLLSAASNKDDQHFMLGFRHDGITLQAVFQQPLPERGHHIAVNTQRGFLVSVARRPGTTLVLADLEHGQITRTLKVPADRHLYGHGVFSADGSLFYTTENAFDDDTERSGRLVIWAVQGSGSTATLARTQEFATGGIGPHELLLMPDGDTLAIANGGIRTHPSHDRDILNLDSMLPSLAYVNRQTGEIVEQRFLPQEFHQGSIRHIDVNAAGKLAIGMQFEGEKFRSVPLVAVHQRGEELQLLLASPEEQPQMQQYVGAIRFAADGRHIAVSCPRGNLFTVWDADTGQLVKTLRARDNCGVMASQRGFVYSTGMGKVAEFHLASGEITEFDGAENLHLLWDNHITADVVLA